jgi:lipopolysaccharide biosynthesis protein
MLELFSLTIFLRWNTKGRKFIMRFISFYLPQYHPIPENDFWWGKGFTDWVNVKKCNPRFSSHYQPHIPSELGYYDLRDQAVRSAQAHLASTFGIDAFCYYHYWFNGKRLLNKPFDAVISTKTPNFPFCLCWANENWTRIWDGKENKTLIGQQYSMADNKTHIEWLCRIFKDKRYLCINGKPIFLIYRTDKITNFSEMILLWKRYVKRAGFPGLYLCAVRSNFPQKDGIELIEQGVDAIIDFQPNKRDYPNGPLGAYKFLGSLNRKVVKYINLLTFKNKQIAQRYLNRRISYNKLAKNSLRTLPLNYKYFPCVFPSWDNSARHEIATIIQNNNPDDYGIWLQQAADFATKYPEEEQIVFINAWNEWAEGCHLEPDLRFGRAFLEKTLQIRQLYK